MTAMAVARPKEIDSVLLRIPAELKELASAIALEEKVSANAVYTAGILYATIIYGQQLHIGVPDNLKRLISEIDQSVQVDQPLVGAFNISDWNEVHWLPETLNALGWIEKLAVRTDVQAASTIVYTFSITKAGRTLWPPCARLLRALIACCPDQQGYIVSTATNAISPA
jgi:hypothetical protein